MPLCPVCSIVFGDGVQVCPHDGVMLVEEDPLVGRTLDGKYRIDARLGAGGMGAVYRATQIALERAVAIKVILGASADAPVAIRRFQREALAVARLRHPHIVAVHDFGVAPGFGAYLVLEYLEGRSLRDELKLRNRIPAREAVEWMAQICAAVHAAHVAGLVHRDLKPDNVILERTGDGRVVKVLDFGIATFTAGSGPMHTPLTGAGGIIGTPYYMSPEQCRGEAVTPASDIYALGCVLYELLTGRPPFQGDSTPGLLYQHVSVAPVPPSMFAPEIPAALDAAILRAIDKDPGARFATAQDLRRAMTASAPDASADTLPLADAPPAVAPRRDASTPAHNLPTDVSRFVGRETECADAQRALDSARILTVTGAGGIGKTRLAVRVAATVRDAHADGVWLVELAETTDPAGVDGVVAAALGVRDDGTSSTRELLLGHLRGRRTLIVLDNCEHVLATASEFAASVLRACAGVTILATSREPLAIDGESVLPLGPLSVDDGPDDGPRPGDRMSDAVTLFVDRARLGRPNWALTDEDVPAVVELCRRLDGIPLAIELAAARVRSLTVRQILERLAGYGILSRATRTGPMRQQTLHETVSWSYSLLEEPDRLLLQRLSVFAGGWSLEAAECVTPGDGLDAADVLDGLARLVDKSLITMEETSDGARYRILETIRVFAAGRLAESGAADAIARVHRIWVRTAVEDAFADFGGPEHERWHRRVNAEHANAIAALEWGRSSATDRDENLRLAVALGAFWETYGHWRTAVAWLERELEASPDADRITRGRALFRLGSLAIRQARFARARELYEGCLDLIRDSDRNRMVAEALAALGRIAGALGEVGEAVRLLTESLELNRSDGTPITIASALVSLGTLTRDTGDLPRAAAMFDEALQICRDAEFAQGVCVTLCERAKLALAMSDAAAAARLAAEAVDMARRGDMGVLVAQTQRVLGEALLTLGETDRAAVSFDVALRQASALGAREDVVLAIEDMAWLRARTGDSRLAVVLWTAAAGARLDLADPPSKTERERLEAEMQAAREKLGDALADVEREAGGISLEQAVARALGPSRAGTAETRLE